MPRPMSPEELEYQGHQIYFFDDLEALPQFWTASNRENVAELLIDFFRYFANSFRYGFDVVSVRTPGGLLSKEEKGWLHDFIEDGSGGKGYARVDLNRLCIEVRPKSACESGLGADGARRTRSRRTTTSPGQ